VENKNPFAASVIDYIMGGWSPLVIPLARKSPPPYKYTGAGALLATEETMLGEWLELGGNIALKMSSFIIGIDIDRDKKTGETVGMNTLRKLEAKLGPLPIEFVISNQDDLAAGFTAFFIVPEGVKWKQSAGAKIDIIQDSHRYQMAPPSIHPDGGIYRWKSYHHNITVSFVPEVDSLPLLPAAWVEFLTMKDEKTTKKPAEKDTSFEVESIDLGGTSCNLMRAIVGTRIKDLSKAEIVRHDEMVKATWAIVNEGNKGHGGALHALDAYMVAWLARFSAGETRGRDLEAEFASAVNRAIMKMGESKKECSCGTRPPSSGDYKGYQKKQFKRVSDFKMWR
jgi:hypothetical protein